MTFVQCWAKVEDVWPTLCKCYTNVLCLLGSCFQLRANNAGCRLRDILVGASLWISLEMSAHQKWVWHEKYWRQHAKYWRQWWQPPCVETVSEYPVSYLRSHQNNRICYLLCYLQSHGAVTACWESKQLLPFRFARQYWCTRPFHW